MKSTDTLKTQYGRLTKNGSSDNLTVGLELMNDEHRDICAMADWHWLHKTRTLTTVADQQFYNLAYDVDQVESVFITVSGTRHTPKLLHSREQWDRINKISNTSDFPEYAFVFGGQIGFWPTPSSSSNTITLNAKLRVIDLLIADFVTGTVDVVTNGDATVVGSGTSWTTPMANRYLRITHSNTAASSGDGLWYEIDSMTDGTNLELVRLYGGTSLTTGASAAYIIGQMPLLPENYHDAILYQPAAIHWYNNDDSVKGDKYMAIFDRKIESMKKHHSAPVTDLILDDGLDEDLINNNLTISL